MAPEETNSVHSPEFQHESPTTSTTTPTTAPPATLISPVNLTATSPKPAQNVSSSSKKRSATTLEPNGTVKVTKRRAARACVSCRARKVRCDVVEGAPCGNCRWDGVECIIQESRRRKKGLFDTASHLAETHLLKAKTANPHALASTQPGHSQGRSGELCQTSAPNSDIKSPVRSRHDSAEVLAPHLQSARTNLISAVQSNHQGSRYPNIFPQPLTSHRNSISTADSRTGADIEASKAAQFPKPLDEPDLFFQKYGFLRPLPPKIVPEDIDYLRAKGALSVPSFPLQKALLRAYVEFVHPYNPLLDLHNFLSIIDARDGSRGQISLFLYQAVMFCATAFVSNEALKKAGYASRKAARRAFFSKTRLLYDFDYENDRLVLVQGLLLMSYWYETPDDQKDTWHWMGVAISLGHTIGLHRNPENANTPPKRRKLWKRIWWSCFLRDRLIALGMRRPIRIKDEDFDVPMLDEEDFDLEVLPDHIQVVDPECVLLRDVSMQRELAQMCVAKAKLSLCISDMLKAQYSVLIRAKTYSESMTSSTMMLLPNKELDNMESIAQCDAALLKWADQLPESCKYRPLSALSIQNGREVVAVQRNLLHMVYFTTVSALHRPLFLPSLPRDYHQIPSPVQQQMSRLRVCNSAAQITKMAAEMNTLGLDAYLPTTGVTVILPAMIIHMIEMKNPLPVVQAAACAGFQQCMRVMNCLRNMYAAADYAVAFVNAAMRKGAQVTQARTPQSFDGANNNEETSAEGLKVTMMAPYVGSRNHSMPTGIENVTTPPPEPLIFPATAEDDPASMLMSDPTLSSDVTQEFVSSSNMSTFTDPSSNSQINNNVNVGSTAVSGAMIGAHSPPSTDIMTPVSSTISAASPFSAEHALEIKDTDLDGFADNPTDDFDWNSLTCPNIDFDQWLQFPPGEGAAVGPGMGLNVDDNGLVALSQIEGSNSDLNMWSSEGVAMA
ncbi:fungal-specific transcription factor domain-containing protein [Xylaria nigripes]|nr:fungal-specific transcription factor domain-containing protein [Xylaria nigripes]